MKINNLPELSNRTSSAGKVTLRTGEIISGEVFHSKHDRVSEIHASGGMSTSSSTSLYQGTGSARSDASFSFEIHSKINTRHEFWVRTGNFDVQFVFFTHIPITDGHDVSILPVSYEVNGQPITLGFLLENRSANRSVFYAVQGKQANTLLEAPSAQAIAALVEDRFVSDAFGSPENCFETDPEAKAELLKAYQEFGAAPGMAYWTFTVAVIIGTTVIGWFSGSGLMERFVLALFGFILGGLIVAALGKLSGAQKRADRTIAKLEENKKRAGLVPLNRAIAKLFA